MYLTAPQVFVCAGACEAACKLAAGCSWLARNRAELVWVGNCPPAACVCERERVRASKGASEGEREERNWYVYACAYACAQYRGVDARVLVHAYVGVGVRA